MKAFDILHDPWPWYLAGPLMGATIPLLLYFGNKMLGASSSLKHICALGYSKLPYFQYNVRSGYWNILFVAGVCLGATICFHFFYEVDQVAIAMSTRNDLLRLGITDFEGLLPAEIFGDTRFLELRTWIFTLGGGFLVGFGVRYAGGCTSGHGFMGLSQMSRASFIAILSFFAGGMFFTYVILPYLIIL